MAAGHSRGEGAHGLAGRKQRDRSRKEGGDTFPGHAPPPPMKLHLPISHLALKSYQWMNLLMKSHTHDPPPHSPTYEHIRLLEGISFCHHLAKTLLYFASFHYLFFGLSLLECQPTKQGLLFRDHSCILSTWPRAWHTVRAG